MWLKRDDFIQRKLQILCSDCQKRARILLALCKELPEEGSFDEMSMIFEEIAKKEA